MPIHDSNNKIRSIHKYKDVIWSDCKGRWLMRWMSYQFPLQSLGLLLYLFLKSVCVQVGRARKKTHKTKWSTRKRRYIYYLSVHFFASHSVYIVHTQSKSLNKKYGRLDRMNSEYMALLCVSRLPTTVYSIIFSNGSKMVIQQHDLFIWEKSPFWSFE